MPTSRSRLGAHGEEIARRYIEAKGYEILETNFRCSLGEINVIAKDGPYLVFLEVRTRRGKGGYGTPEESLDRRKRDRLVATAETYFQGCSVPPEEWRIDLVGVRMSVGGTLEAVVNWFIMMSDTDKESRCESSHQRYLVPGGWLRSQESPGWPSND